MRSIGTRNRRSCQRISVANCSTITFLRILVFAEIKDGERRGGKARRSTLVVPNPDGAVAGAIMETPR
jgi:hypothetical protein